VHKRSHSGERPYVCDEPDCEFRAIQAGDLKRHKRAHSGLRPYVCDEPDCEYRAIQAGDLKRHKRIHGGVRPYVCDEPDCEYRATQASDLKRHTRVHSGVRPYPCNEHGCEYRAARIDILETHKRKHTGEQLAMKSRSLLLLIQSQQDDAKKARLEAYSAALGGMDMGSAWERFYSTQTQNPSSMVRRAMHAPGEAGLRVSSEKEMKAYRPSSPTELVEGELSRFSELSGHDPLAKATNAQILGMTKHASARRHPVLTRQLLHATRPQTPALRVPLKPKTLVPYEPALRIFSELDMRVPSEHALHIP
ncbi:hypothetical protein T492DRAFT_881689, partial [Pavlovales sp. CCMP2436]